MSMAAEVLAALEGGGRAPPGGGGGPDDGDGDDDGGRRMVVEFVRRGVPPPQHTLPAPALSPSRTCLSVRAPRGGWNRRPPCGPAGQFAPGGATGP